MTASYSSYKNACSIAPDPTKAKDDEGKKISAAQRQRYKTELAEELKTQCREQIDFSKSILQGWLSEKNDLHPRIEALLKEITS